MIKVKQGVDKGNIMIYALVQQRKAENVEQLGKEKEGEKDDKKRVK